MSPRARIGPALVAAIAGGTGCTQLIGADFGDKCLKLKSDDCTTVYPPEIGECLVEDALVIGSIFPTTGPDASSGRPIEDAIKLAIDDFSTNASGLPPLPGSTALRPIVLVGCSDGSDSDTAVRAARHLTGDLGLPAIVGPAYSGITIKVAAEVTIPAGTLLISPSATSASITNLADNGLVWRTSPSDTYQAKALSLYVPTIEQQVRGAVTIPPGSGVKVAVVNKGDAYGTGLANALEQQLMINGASVGSAANMGNYKHVDYGNPDDPTTDPPRYAQTVAEVLAFQPHILLIFGTTEAVTSVFEPIESGWTASYRAQIVFSDGGEIPELWNYVATHDPTDTVRKRVTGTAPGTNSNEFRLFLSEFTGSKYHTGPNGPDPTVFGVAGAYDSLYLLAYSAAALGRTPISGASLAGGIGHLVPPGAPIDADPSQITSAFQVLSSGNDIDYNGASGPLDFDTKTGEAPSDIQIWCLPRDPATQKATSAIFSGRYLDARSLTLSGAPSACP